jgi:DNA repair protein RadC
MPVKYKKGSAAAKAFMAKLRAAKGKNKPKLKVPAKLKLHTLGAVKKAAPKKKAPAKGSHKDTKSHNVKISVVSGKPLKNNIKRIFGYEGTARKGNKTTVHYSNQSKLSGYSSQPEIIVGKIGSVSLLKDFAPEVKIKVNRGKRVKDNKIMSVLDSVEILKKFITPTKIQTQEFFAVCYLNNNNNVLAIYNHSSGAITSVSIDTRLIMATALKLAATGMILCHNHPSGNLTPSQADKNITANIIKVANIHDIKVLDHIIITKDGHFSFVENGLLR